MNWRRLAKVLGLLVLLIGSLMGVIAICTGVDAYFRPLTPENRSGLRAMLFSAIIAMTSGGVMYGLGRKAKNEFLRREALATVGLGWILCALFGALPYYLCDPGLGAAESCFESMSGFTTTGASVMQDIESFPYAILLWRAVTQYLGGVGILVLFVAVLSFLGVGGRSLMAQETSLNISESRATKIGETALSLLRVYLVLSGICCTGLLALGMPFFDALCHTMTAISTGGFSPKNASIGHYQSLSIEIWIALFNLLGSISFMIYLLLAKRRKDEKDQRRIRSEEEGKVYLCLVAGAIVVITCNLTLTNGDPVWQNLRNCFFMVITISSTAGFSTADYNQWPLFSKMVLMLLMVIGGCAGSTSGGLKMNRIILFARLAMQELIQSFRPNQVFRIRLNGVAPDPKVLLQGSMFFAIAGTVFATSLVLVALTEPNLDLECVTGAVLGCLFNIGPGFGEVGPMGNYAGLNDGTLVLLSLLMAMGRLEFFVVLVLFVPALWKRY